VTRPSILSRVGGTFAFLLVLIAAGTVAALVAGGSDNVLLLTALTWVLAAPGVLFVGQMFGVDAETMGLRPRRDAPRRPRFVLGVVAGLGLVLLPAVIGRLAGGYVPLGADAAALLPVPSGQAALAAVVYTLPALVIAAIGEEVLFRGGLLRLWEPVMGPRGALVLSALFFVVVHTGNPGASPRGSIGVLLAGIGLGAAFLATGNLWVVAGAHLGWNVGEALVIGVPVSGHTLPSLLRWETADSDLWRGLLGGTFGPEEGLLFHGVLGLATGAALVSAAASGVFAARDGSDESSAPNTR